MPKRKHGLVSVIVTNYQNANYIKACLDSIRKQSYREFELIVVDDCSTDESRHLIRHWKKRYKHRLKHRMLFVSMPRNIGFPGVLNVAMYLAKGEFIAVQDGDDISHPERIEKQVDYLRQHPDIGIVGTNYRLFTEQHTTPLETPAWLAFTPGEVQAIYQNGGHCVSHGTILFRRELFDKYGGPTRRLAGAEDYEMIAKCVQDGVGVTNLQDVLYFYRRHDKQRSRHYYGA
ncbi:glycosyltransferase family 2 protein [Alicyclobacillus fodiniaquatilis]|uniref:Glycosyltransferase family 2 protein n=1 Tax=Alicyclobacillus fodiniaquatilis TaxID=1661150 RepID=A0ABW4JHL9_9BACL